MIIAFIFVPPKEDDRRSKDRGTGGTSTASLADTAGDLGRRRCWEWAFAVAGRRLDQPGPLVRHVAIHGTLTHGKRETLVSASLGIEKVNRK